MLLPTLPSSPLPTDALLHRPAATTLPLRLPHLLAAVPPCELLLSPQSKGSEGCCQIHNTPGQVRLQWGSSEVIEGASE
jgi:hypothetical protein